MIQMGIWGTRGGIGVPHCRILSEVGTKSMVAVSSFLDLFCLLA